MSGCAAPRAPHAMFVFMLHNCLREAHGKKYGQKNSPRYVSRRASKHAGSTVVAWHRAETAGSARASKGSETSAGGSRRRSAECGSRLSTKGTESRGWIANDTKKLRRNKTRARSTTSHLWACPPKAEVEPKAEVVPKPEEDPNCEVLPKPEPPSCDVAPKPELAPPPSCDVAPNALPLPS